MQLAGAYGAEPVVVPVGGHAWTLHPCDADALRVVVALGCSMGQPPADQAPVGSVALWADASRALELSMSGVLLAPTTDDPVAVHVPAPEEPSGGLLPSLIWLSTALAEATVGRLDCSPACGLYHAALASLDGQGVLLAAPGGTGKTTASSRLPARWRSWSDDTCYLADDPRGGWCVHPWPTWSRLLTGPDIGSWPVSERVPLRAVCFLEQAPADSITPVGRGEAAVRLYAAADQARSLALRQTSPEAAQARRARWFAGAAALSAAVPSFVLRLTLDGQFWELIEAALA